MNDCNSNSQDAKKRKMDHNHDGVGDGDPSSGFMKMMSDMQREMSSMKRKISGMEEKLENYDHLERECELLRSNLASALGMIASQTCMNVTLSKSVGELESKCNSIEKSMNAKLAFHNQLIRNQNWEYSAEPIKRSFWEENRYYDDYEVEENVDIFSRMQDATTKMRRGEDFGGGFGVGLDLQGRSLIYDHDVMYSHWKEFANALSQYRYYLDQCPKGDLFGVYFCNVQLVPDIIGMLKKALKWIDLRDLSLEYNGGIVDDLYVFLSELLQENEHCQVLSIEGNRFVNRFDGYYTVLWERIGNHPFLQRINLKKCLNKLNAPILLGEALPKFGKLKHLNLSYNGIRQESVTLIAAFLETNLCLIELNLFHNPIDDDDAAKIAAALASNNTLRELDMECNGLTKAVGARALRRAIYGDETGLNCINVCNHTCRIISDWRSETNGNNGKNPIINRRRKLYMTLNYHHRKYSNVIELIERELPEDDKANDFAQKLMPIVLESIQLYAEPPKEVISSSGCINPLSIVYAIMRGWRMPLLYI